MRIKDDYNNFKKLLKKGEDGEDEVINFLTARGNVLLDSARDKGKFTDWDIKIKNPQGNELTFEVKTDAYISDNIVIEFKSRGKASGIYSTKADIYLIYFPNEGTIYTANSGELRLWIAENSPTIKMNKNNDSNTYLYVIPKSQLEDLFTVHEVK